MLTNSLLGRLNFSAFRSHHQAAFSKLHQSSLQPIDKSRMHKINKMRSDIKQGECVMLKKLSLLHTA